MLPLYERDNIKDAANKATFTRRAHGQWWRREPTERDRDATLRWLRALCERCFQRHIAFTPRGGLKHIIYTMDTL